MIVGVEELEEREVTRVKETDGRGGGGRKEEEEDVCLS